MISPRLSAAALALSAALLSSCKSGIRGAHQPAPDAPPLSVGKVEWNPSHAEVGEVVAIAEQGDELLVFGKTQAALLVRGSVVTVDHSAPGWIGGGALPAADGNGSWLVGIDSAGVLRRLRGRASFEPISDRYGLTGAPVRDLCVIGGKRVVFLLDRQIAVADGTHVTRYDAAFTGLACGGGLVAGYGPSGVEIVDTSGRNSRAFTLPVSRAAVAGDGRLYAASASRIYAQNPEGALAVRYDGASPIDSLAVSGAQAWFAEKGELGLMQGESITRTRGLELPPGARLVGASSGGVWAIAGGALLRLSPAQGQDSLINRWDASIRPVFERSCTPCHSPGGTAGLELGSAEAWQREHSNIQQRVLVDRSMPPYGRTLADADREAIHAWLVGSEHP